MKYNKYVIVVPESVQPQEEQGEAQEGLGWQAWQGPHLRYEVIFKNLLRDFSKYYSTTFNEQTDYIRK